MSLLDRLLRRNQVRARCPRCGEPVETYWANDELVQVIGDHTGEHQVLRASCDVTKGGCGWEGRANNPRVLVLK